MNPHFEMLLGRVYDGALAPEHLADLRKSGLTDETIAANLIRSVPPAMISQLLGFEGCLPYDPRCSSRSAQRAASRTTYASRSSRRSRMLPDTQ